MREIRLLDNNTINKISAGEVVERPSSVDKELAENSIDAGASAVTIEIRDGGTSLIKISDNGSGIPKEQVKTAFLRHATSKISDIEDLDYIYSLGFRGEALASIASVSQIEMVTKTQNEELGCKIEISGGNMIEESECACAGGTSITVKNIFFNVPARRKFLKKPATESGYISDTVNKLALAHPEISFKYINNGNVMLHTSGNNDLKTAVFHVYGKEMSQKMIDVSCEENGFRLFGLIGKPELSRGNRNYENLFINGRFIKNDVVSQAVEEAYKTRLMIGKFPVFILSLTLSADMVDVNVHPAKLEVRFRDDDVIYDFIYNAVYEALKSIALIPKSDWNSAPSEKVKKLIENGNFLDNQNSCANKDEGNTAPHDSNRFKQEVIPETNITEVINKNIFSKVDESVKYNSEGTRHSIDELKELYKNKMDSEDINGGKNILKERQLGYIPDKDVGQEIMPTPDNIEELEQAERFFNNYKITGQIFSTYWIVEQGSSIFLIDQHAAHERILFERIMNEFKNGDVVSQRILQPIALNLSEKEAILLNENVELMERFGFDIEFLGGINYVIKGMPYIFQTPENLSFFTEILDTLGVGQNENVYDKKIHTIATIACKAAVKANDKLSVQEAVSLIERLLKLDNPFSCPHGRPTIIELTKYELEKKFKRIQ